MLVFYPVSKARKAPPPFWAPLLVGALFGISGMFRVTDICFAPVVLFLVIRGACSRKDFKSCLSSIFLLGVGAVVGFGPQLLVNFYQSGNPLLLPYYLFHSPAVGKGFQPANLSWGGAYSFGLISIFLGLALAGLVGGGRRITCLAALLLFPTLLFYNGYFGIQGIRYLLPTLPILVVLASYALARLPLSVVVFVGFTWLFKPQMEGDWLEQLRPYSAMLLVAIIVSAGILLIARWRHWPRLQKKGMALSLCFVSQLLITLANFPSFRYLFMLYVPLFLILSWPPSSRAQEA